MSLRLTPTSYIVIGLIEQVGEATPYRAQAPGGSERRLLLVAPACPALQRARAPGRGGLPGRSSARRAGAGESATRSPQKGRRGARCLARRAGDPAGGDARAGPAEALLRRRPARARPRAAARTSRAPGRVPAHPRAHAGRGHRRRTGWPSTPGFATSANGSATGRTCPRAHDRHAHPARTSRALGHRPARNARDAPSGRRAGGPFSGRRRPLRAPLPRRAPAALLRRADRERRADPGRRGSW